MDVGGGKFTTLCMKSYSQASDHLPFGGSCHEKKNRATSCMVCPILGERDRGRGGKNKRGVVPGEKNVSVYVHVYCLAVWNVRLSSRGVAVYAFCHVSG